MSPMFALNLSTPTASDNLFMSLILIDDLNGSVGSIADLKLKGPGVKEVEDIGLTNRPRKRSKFVYKSRKGRP
jgi:hypothetical protein